MKKINRKTHTHVYILKKTKNSTDAHTHLNGNTYTLTNYNHFSHNIMHNQNTGNEMVRL